MKIHDDCPQPAPRAPRAPNCSGADADMSSEPVLGLRERAGSGPSPAEVVHLQRMAGNAALAELLTGGRSPVLDVVGRGGGRPLDAGVREQMERAFGEDFRDVRIHSGPEASDSAASVQATAYTVGSEIVFGDSQYSPGTTDGMRRLVHELTHVVQQRHGPVDGMPRAGGIAVSSPSDRFERAATTNADQVMASLSQSAPVAGRAQAATESAGAEPVAQRVQQGGGSRLNIQREETPADVLKMLATPQVDVGPAIGVQKKLIGGLEELIGMLASRGPKKDPESEHGKKFKKHLATFKKENKKYLKEDLEWNKKQVGNPPVAPSMPKPVREGGVKGNEVEFHLGGILFDGLPDYEKGNIERFYQDLASSAKLISPEASGARSYKPTTLPEVVNSDLGPLLRENVLRTMIDASQFKYLRAARFPNKHWKIFAEVTYIRARPKDMSGFHKDTRGQTLFVNLNYHVERAGQGLDVRGPEYVLNPPFSDKHQRRLPEQFTGDLAETRGRLGDPTEIRSAGTVKPYGYVAFVDEAIHHATPFFDHRYVTPKELKGYLGRKYPEIISLRNGHTYVDWKKVPEDDADQWMDWLDMASVEDIVDEKTGPKVRYTRGAFAKTMKPGEFELMLEDVGKQVGAAREHGGAGGFYNAKWNEKTSPLKTDGKTPLVRQASDSNLTENWPPQLADDVDRRFIRTWVRAVPESEAKELRKGAVG